MIKENLNIPSKQISDFCQHHHIRRLAFFGSVLNESFGLDSDVDILVEFDPEHIPGFAFFDMEEDLSALLGRKVELHTAAFLSPYIREEVLSTVQEVYIEK